MCTSKYQKGGKIVGTLVSIVGTTLIVKVDGNFIAVDDLPEEIVWEYEPFVGEELPFTVQDIVSDELVLDLEPTDEAIILVLSHAIKGILTGEMDMEDGVTIQAFLEALEEALKKPDSDQSPT